MSKTMALALLVTVVVAFGLMGCGGTGNVRESKVVEPGPKIVYMSSYGIYTMEGSGLNPTNLTASFSGQADWPSWSRDRKQVAFESTHSRASKELYVKDIASGVVKRVTNDTMQKDGFATWSPDGTKLIYSANPAGSPNWYLYSINVSGSGRTKLTTYGQDDSPSWSPDGTTIVYSSMQGTGRFQLWTMKPDGTAKKRLTTYAGWDRCPRWSPQGKKIVFAREFTGNREICTMNADGTGVKRLTNDPAYDSGPTWDPTAQFIVFGRSGALLRMNADGTSLHKLRVDAADASWLGG